MEAILPGLATNKHAHVLVTKIQQGQEVKKDQKTRQEWGISSSLRVSQTQDTIVNIIPSSNPLSFEKVFHCQRRHAYDDVKRKT